MNNDKKLEQNRHKSNLKLSVMQRGYSITGSPETVAVRDEQTTIRHVTQELLFFGGNVDRRFLSVNAV